MIWPSLTLLRYSIYGALLGLSFLATSAKAEEAFNPNSRLQEMLNQDRRIQTREGTVVINGIQYQKLEIDHESYYIKLQHTSGDNLQLLCERPQGYKSEHLVEGSLKLKRRRFFYIKALRESCQSTQGQSQKQLSPDIELGIFLPNKPNDIIKNKRIGINPINPLVPQFRGEF